jgi:hypothetical protein
MITNIFSNRPEAPSIGSDQIKGLEKEKQVEFLIELARKRGRGHAIEVAKGLDDPYVLDRFHDDLAKMEKLKQDKR